MSGMRSAMSLIKRGALGIALAAAMLCLFASGTRAATRHVTHPKKHALKAKKTISQGPKKAGVQRVSYGYKKAALRRRHTRRRYRRHHITLPSRPSPGRTEEIQTALARGGYYTGEPNGKWDSRMSDALQRFQSANGLTPTGKLDALSLEKMGLGSDVAGVSAPRTVTPSNPNSAPAPAAKTPAGVAPPHISAPGTASSAASAAAPAKTPGL